MFGILILVHMRKQLTQATIFIVVNRSPTVNLSHWLCSCRKSTVKIKIKVQDYWTLFCGLNC